MENIELYTKNNAMQRQYNIEVLKEFCPRLSWPNEKESVLDVGCGPGDVTAEILLPLLPPSASLVGVDINPNMVDYADRNYRNTRLEFKVLDFTAKCVTDVFQESNFSKIFSFYCLHWVRDKEQFAKNMFTLLNPGGEFLIVAALTDQMFKVYKILSQMTKWEKFMKDVDDVIPRLFYSTNPCKEIETLLNRQGLEVITCEEREHDIVFSSMDDLLRAFEAVNPFVKRMNQETRRQFMASFGNVVVDNKLTIETISGEVCLPSLVIIIHGRRPPSDVVNSNQEN